MHIMTLGDSATAIVACRFRLANRKKRSVKSDVRHVRLYMGHSGVWMDCDDQVMSFAGSRASCILNN
jgi:hypothetical protein